MTSLLEELPPELLPFILVYLSPEDATALARTCRRMNILVRNENLWRRYFLCRYETTGKKNSIEIDSILHSDTRISRVYLDIPLKNIYWIVLGNIPNFPMLPHGKNSFDNELSKINIFAIYSRKLFPIERCVNGIFLSLSFELKILQYFRHSQCFVSLLEIRSFCR